ncbi:hypothetical protein FRC01_010434 [Tulasnella sp. 417]|nr:hypothetical protein FRC01_010434 [Tulasnella sp. 417]
MELEEYPSRRRSMFASDINWLAEDAKTHGGPYSHQKQHQVYGNSLMPPAHPAPLSAEYLDPFAPPVHQQHSMQELQVARSLVRAGRSFVPNLVIDPGTPLEKESDGTFASAHPTSTPVTRDATADKRALRTLLSANARGGINNGATGAQDDTHSCPNMSPLPDEFERLRNC